LASLGDLPSRNLSDLRQRLTELSQESVATPFFMTAPNGASPVPKIYLNKPAVIVARKNAIP